LAALAAVGVASAQSSVTLSGTLEVAPLRDQSITDTAASSTTPTEVKTRQTGQHNTWSTSIINITATEDLGGGLTARAVLISGMDGSAPAGTVSPQSGIGGRERTLELASRTMGALRFGLFAPAALGNLNALQGTGSATMVGTIYAITAGGTGNAVLNQASGVYNMERQPNVLQYTSPSINGFTATVYNVTNSADSNASTSVGTTATKQHGVGLGYAAGPLSLGFSLNKQTVTTEAATQAAYDAAILKHDLNWVVASYDFGVARLALSHATRETDLGTAKVGDIKLTQLAVTAPMGALTLRGSFYTGKDARGTANTDNLKLSGHQLSATYALSKRTSLVAAMAKAENKRDGAASTAATRKTEQTTLTMNHTF
jgi:GBP family porin